MRKILLITTALCLAASVANAQEDTQKQNYIEVSTRADKQITPDEIYLSITLNELDSKGKISVEKQETEMFKALKGIKIDVEKDLTVKDMDSDLKTYFLKKDNILVSKSYILKVNTAAQAAAAMEALNTVKISNVSLDRTAISPTLEKQTKDQLLTEAAKKAQENAQILASAVGSQAGKVIYIQNYYTFSQPYTNFALRSSKAMLANDGNVYESAPVIEVSKTPVSVNVMCRFEIK
ncbi:MAG: SIMPL domain-containing protein [Bacteroidales bacterium]